MRSRLCSLTRRLLNRKERPRIDPAAVKKILLIRLRRIGDVAMTTPALVLLRQHFPSANISYIAETPSSQMLIGHPALDEVITIPRHPGKKELLALVRSLRRKKYDIVLDLHGGPRAFLLTLLSGAGLRVGYKIKYKHIFYNIKRPRRPKQGYYHSVENHVNLIKTLGISSANIPPLTIAPPSEQEIKRIAAFLTENALDQKKLICLHIGAGNRFRNWGVKNLARLLDLLEQESKTAVILIGAEEDRAAAEQLLNRPGSGVYSLVGKIGLPALQALLSRAALFIGADSGPMHIAAAVQIPIIAFFGPTLPDHFSPWKAPAVILEKEFACRPCRQTECIFADYRCLMNITPEEVFTACSTFL